MMKAQNEVEDVAFLIVFPASKEELINGLLVGNAPARMAPLVERLPRDHYENHLQLCEDLEEVSRVHAREVRTTHRCDNFHVVVLPHMGDVQHTAKGAYNRAVEHIIHIAQQQGTLSGVEARTMEQRLDAAFADLRGTRSHVYDDRAPVDPYRDLPQNQP